MVENSKQVSSQSQWDVMVIGSSIGGLSAVAALVALPWSLVGWGSFLNGE